MKVRIKVLIDSKGHYCGYGWQDAADKDPDDTLYDAIGFDGSPVQEYWITADLPLPVVPEVVAQIEAA